ncbi:MAG: M15 family metallopeptidase [bacterium]
MKIFKSILLLVFCFATWSSVAQLPKGFVYVESIIPTIQYDLRYSGSNNFVGERIDGYEREVVILTEAATLALKKVQDELNGFGLSIIIYDSYRPQQSVDHFIRWARDLEDKMMKPRFYPDVEKRNLFKEEYIASRSGHSRGSTLDIGIVDLTTCEALDMGSPFDFFGKESWVANTELTLAQRSNRALLQSIMKKYGFRNYSKEWWHFTLNGEPFPKTYFNFPVR